MGILYLKALEIQGFKSFPDKTVFSFGGEVTAIVGPNGSGKSNISDALRWVMGEQSTRALRGAKMEDVIFDGTQTRKGLGFAEVSLVLDNSGHFFNMEEAEVVVTRRYYRSGESEFYINRRSVRLRDVNELFMDTGLGREGYSIIGQGKIDEILSVKSGDRREIFEEAAGISRFRHRKEEAERKLARTEENLVRINDRIAELELQVEPLRVQSEKAKRFLVLRDELRVLEISVWLESLERIRTNGLKIHTDCETAVRQRDTLQREVETLYRTAEELSAAMRERDVEADRIRFELSAREADANELDSAIAVLKTNIRNNAENMERLRGEMTAQEGRATGIAAQIDERRARVAEIEAEHSALRGKLAELAQQAEESGKSAGTLADELENLRRRQAMETASAAEAKALLSALGAAAQECMDREETLGRELIAQGDALTGATEAARGVADELERAKEERANLQNVIGGYDMRVAARARRAEQAAEALRRLQMDEHSLQSRISMLTEMEKVFEGYSKAVRTVMGESTRGGLRGLHGPVANLLHVPDEYTVAIEIALGGAMGHIVAADEESAKAAILYLKRRDAGRATFLPLTTIEPLEFRDGAVVDEPGFVGFGDELIQFDKKYEKIFASLLGRIVIAETMDLAIAMARRYRYRFRIVTLDGQVIHPGGSMTGGSTSNSAGILSRANELERLHRQSAELGESRKAAARTCEEAEREHTAARYELDAARGQLREQEDAILTLEGRQEAAKATLAALEAQQAAVTAELGEVRVRLTQTARDGDAARARIAQLEGTAAATAAEAESTAQGQTELQRRLTALSGEMAALTARMAALEAESAASVAALGELETLRRDIAGDHTGRLALIEEFEEKNRTLTGQIAQNTEKLDALRAAHFDKQEAVRCLNEEKLALEADRVRADRESREKNTQLLSMEREVSVLEQKRLSFAMEEKNILDKLWESYELSHEAARAVRIELESVPKAARRIGELKREISGLGNINLDAIEEYQRVNERYTYFTEQRDDVARSKAELEQIIAAVTEEMRTIFATQFALIAQSFSETFLELFGGGRATLELEDEEDILNCGIEIRAQPPGKALKTITLLSGGERAFIAIALYFSILKVRPTPFCVMDEIEAALDEVNVVRFARYLRQMADKTQFIIITHRRGTMEEADVLYGITMQEKGISRVLTINLNDVSKELNLA